MNTLKLRLATVVSLTLALAAGFASRPASALPGGSEPEAGRVVYDEAAAVCYVADAVPGTADAAEPQDCLLPCVELPNGRNCVCKVP